MKIDKIYWYTNGTAGGILLIVVAATSYKVFKGSKSQFAYTLLAFTLAVVVTFLMDFWDYGNFAAEAKHLITMLVPLQQWVFAIRYLNSAITCSLDESPLLSKKAVQVVLWSGITFYTACQLGLLIWVSVAWYSSNKTKYQPIYGKLYASSYYLWSVFILVGTSITVVAIRSIFKTVTVLKQTNLNLRFEKETLVVHAILLLLLTISAILQTFYNKYYDESQIGFWIVTFSMFIIEWLTQIGICYICWTMGSSVHLRRFEMTIYRNQQGRFSVGFTLRHSSDLAESEKRISCQLLEEDESVLSNSQSYRSTLLTKSGTLSQSNTRGCDEIMQQFCAGLGDSQDSDMNDQIF